MDDIEVRAFVDASRDAVRRALSDLRVEADRAEALRAAEHRAFMAESREADAKRDRDHADAVRALRDALATVKDGTPGRDGIDGKDGRDGVDGAAGKAGPVGPAGPQGEQGIAGEAGERGADGAPGEVGPAGSAGPQGETGEQGLPGDVGPAGEPGSNGVDGLNGKDGADAYHGEARGLFDAAAVYRALDVVSFNGSEWRAKRDAPGDLPGDGWMLSACRGKKGEPGKGISGANLVAAYVERDTATLVMTRDDGVEIKADLSALLRSARDTEN